jgi:hypothetical protein
MFNVKGLHLNELCIVEFVTVLKSIKLRICGVVVELHAFLIAVLYEGQRL